MKIIINFIQNETTNGIKSGITSGNIQLLNPFQNSLLKLYQTTLQPSMSVLYCSGISSGVSLAAASISAGKSEAYLFQRLLFCVYVTAGKSASNLFTNGYPQYYPPVKAIFLVVD